ncbi:MAG: hypothetical protein IKC14_06420 [Kiritimatiellae bacterium]|nr:hypothetical protein [Kiritimatiellia bacterium]
MKRIVLMVLSFASVVCLAADPDYERAVFYTKMSVSGGKSGGQRVATGYSPNGGTIIRARYASRRQNTKNEACNQCLYCARNSTKRTTDKPDFSFFLSVNGKPRFDYYGSSVPGGTPYETNCVYDLLVKDGKAVVTDVVSGATDEMTVGLAGFDPKFPIYLFSSYEYSSGVPAKFGNSADIDFYFLEIYELKDGKEELVHRYVPCKVDSAVYVADTVTQTLLTVTPASGGFSVNNEDLLSIEDRLEVAGAPEAFGEVDPPYGRMSGLKAGDEMTLTAPKVWTNEAGTVAATCIGWKLYTYDMQTVSWKHDPENPEHSGSGNVYSYVHPTPAAARRLEWQFQKEVKISAVVPEGAEVTGTGWYKVGSTVTLKALCDEDRAFSKWVGLPAEASALSETTSFEVRDPLEVTAVFGGVRHLSAEDDLAAVINELGENGGTIYLADTGDTPIKLAQTITISTPVRIIGHAGDASRVVIDGETKIRPFILDHPEAYLAWITVRRGATPGGTVGGCVQITENGGVIEDCVLERGSATASWNSSGGCLGMYAGRVTRTVMANGACGSHPSGTHGAGLYAASGLVEDCLIVSNSCNNAGSAVFLNGAVTMINCTVTENYGSLYADVQVENAKANVVNCAIFGNRASTDTTGHGHVWRKNAARFFSCAADAEIDGGEGCVFAESAGFKDPARGDFRLTSASCCLDKGARRGAYSVSSLTDLAGNPRVVGTAPDIGCYENQQNEPEVAIVSVAGTFLVPAEVTLTAQATRLPGAATYVWTLTNTTAESDPIVYEQADDPVLDAVGVPPGVYDVALKVRVGGSDYNAATKPAFFQVAPRDIYTSPKNENAAYPYATPETAAPDIQTAVDVAVDGSRVHVLPGETGRYDVPGSVKIRKAISVVGETGDPADIWVYAAGGDGRAFYLNNGGAFLANLSASGNSKQNGKTIIVEGTGGMVSNCVFTSTATTSDWSAGGVVSGINALFTHCVIFGRGHTSTGDATHNGAAARLYTASRLENSLVSNFTYGVSSYGGGHVVSALTRSSVVNCTLVDCRMPDENGTALYVDGTSAATNCAVVGCTRPCKNYEYVEVGDGVVETNLVSTTYPPAPWSGTASRFVNCATDGEAAINETCVLAGVSDFRNYAAGDYRPRQGGVLCGAGAAVEEFETATDLAGKPRRIGRRIDIGCYESGDAAFLLLVR